MLEATSAKVLRCKQGQYDQSIDKREGLPEYRQKDHGTNTRQEYSKPRS